MENVMNIELRNIKTNNALSHETICFSANLYLDGKKLGEVVNRGCGGSHEYSFGYGKDHDKMDEWCKSNLPKWGSEFEEGKEYDTDLEMHLSELVNEFNVNKHMKSLLKRRIVIIDDTCNVGESIQWKKSANHSDEVLIKLILGNNKDLKNPIVLNEYSPIEADKLLHRENK